jgi:hypothetical protein
VSDDSLPLALPLLRITCGLKRLFCKPMKCFGNADGLRYWRCPNCELEDILAYLRREYGPQSSAQFSKHMELEMPRVWT